MNFVLNIASKITYKNFFQRSTVFKCMAGIIATIEIEKLKPILFHIMSPLVREMSTTDESNAPLRQLAKEVATMIKKKTSLEEYSRLLSHAQQRLDTRRTERKRARLQQVNENSIDYFTFYHKNEFFFSSFFYGFKFENNYENLKTFLTPS